MKSKLRHIINPSTPTLICAVAISLLLWIIAFAGHYFSITGSSGFTGDFFDLIAFSISIAVYLITLFNGFLIAQLTHVFYPLRSRGFLPALIFVLLIISWGYLVYIPITIHLSLSFFILASFQFVSMYDNPMASGESFLGSLFVGISMLFFNSLVFILPFFVFVFAVSRCLSLRTFLAFLLGLSCPILLYFTFYFALLNPSDFTALLLPEFYLKQGIAHFSLFHTICFLSMLLALMLCFLKIGLHWRGLKNKTKRNIWIFFVYFLLTLFFFLMKEGDSELFFPFLSFGYTVCFSLVFSLDKSRFRTGLFWFFVIINIMLISYNFLF